LMLTQLYLEQRRFEEANAYLVEAQKISPEDPNVTAMGGLLALEEGRVQDAVTRLTSAAVQLSQHLGVTLALAEAHVLDGEPDKARSLLRNELDRVPQSLPLKAALGTVELRAGDAEQAMSIAKLLQA